MRKSESNAIPLDGDTSFRERAIEPDKTALLLIDLQNGEYNDHKVTNSPEDKYLWDRIRRSVVPNGQKLLTACREYGIEVVYTVIECLTLDGRDRGLDYKISGIFAAKDSWEAEVIDELRPLPNEIIIPKTSSSLFNSTSAEYVLRNLGVQYILMMGIMTDQCVESAVRDGCDRGFLITLIEDCCATHDEQSQQASLRALKGYCRVRKSAEVIAEFTGHA